MRGGSDQVRLMARVARMHHEQGMRQTAIATELHLSTARVSRLLKRAAEEGIVRTIVTLPAGVHTDLEQALEQRYGLAEAVIVDGPDGDEAVLPALGAAAAVYLESTLAGEVVGIASWSSSLLAVMDAMQPTNGYTLRQVVQMVGGHGNPAVQMESSRLIGQFAHLTGAEAIMVPAPGLLGSRQARDSLLADPPVAAVVDRWSEITVALVGIGTLEPSALIRESGNAVPPDQLAHLRGLGAVGDICLRFFDADGGVIDSELDERILGIEPAALLAIPRRVAVAGGMRKLAAIRATLRGGWVTVLVTDVNVARALLA
ncbi:MAG TPA: sugar-binding transcriptional regulator [Cellulomonas sp.]